MARCVSHAICVVLEIAVCFGDAEQEDLVGCCNSRRRAVTRIGVRRDVGGHDFGLFFGCKCCVDEVIARKARANGVVTGSITIQPRTNRALCPSNGNIGCVVELYIEDFFADEEHFAVLDIVHAPCNGFFAVCGVVVLFIMAKGDDVTNL